MLCSIRLIRKKKWIAPRSYLLITYWVPNFLFIAKQNPCAQSNSLQKQEWNASGREKKIETNIYAYWL